MGPEKLAPIHVQILDFIMANPGVNYSDVASYFGYTPGWMSQIVNSDAFKAMLAERQVECFGDIRLTIKDRVEGLAHESLRRLSDKITTEQDTTKITHVADIALKALGFGVQKASGVQINGNAVVVTSPVGADVLENARQLMHKKAPPAERLASNEPQDEGDILRRAAQ